VRSRGRQRGGLRSPLRNLYNSLRDSPWFFQVPDPLLAFASALLYSLRCRPFLLGRGFSEASGAVIGRTLARHRGRFDRTMAGARAGQENSFRQTTRAQARVFGHAQVMAPPSRLTPDLCVPERSHRRPDSFLATTARVSARPVGTPTRDPALRLSRERDTAVGCRQQCCFAWKGALSIRLSLFAQGATTAR
jgi:hypothetical protein